MAHENSLMKTVNADYDMVVSQMASLRDEMTNLAHNVQSMASAKGQDVAESVSGAANYLGRKGHNAEVRVEHAIAGSPFIALGLAAGVGVVLGMLARR